METIGSRLMRPLFMFILSAAPVAAYATAAEALASMTRSDYTSAAKIWQQLITAEPEYVTAMNNLGFCEAMLGNFETAMQVYQKADAISQNLDSKAGVQWAYLGMERYGQSIEWGRAALSRDPSNYWVRLRLAAAYTGADNSDLANKFYSDLLQSHGARQVRGLPTAEITPFYQGINFSGSSFKTKGFDAGVFALWNFDSGVTVGAGYTHDAMQAPSGHDGYQTDEIRMMTGFLFSDLSVLRVSSHLLSSSYDYINKGATVSLAYEPATLAGFSISTDAIIFPQHAGLGVSPQYTWSLGGPFYLRAGAMAQMIAFSQLSKTYAAAQGSLLVCTLKYCLTVGGLYGKLFTPVFDSGSILVYNPDELTGQAFAKFSWSINSYLTVTAAYTYASWHSLNGENPTSNIFTFAATGSFR